MVFDILALVFTALFFGVSTYISFVEHPARLGCPTAAALAQWRQSYVRSVAIQITLVFLAVGCSLMAYLLGFDLSILLGGILLVTVVPFTMIIIIPISRALSDHSRGAETPGTLTLLEQWGDFHSVVTIISFCSLLIQCVHMVALIQDLVQ